MISNSTTSGPAISIANETKQTIDGVSIDQYLEQQGRKCTYGRTCAKQKGNNIRHKDNELQSECEIQCDNWHYHPERHKGRHQLYGEQRRG